MSESPETDSPSADSPSADSPRDLPGVDPEEFVGGAPVGEADPAGFTSGDQTTEAPADYPIEEKS